MSWAYCDATRVPGAYPYFSMFPREPILPEGYVDVKPTAINNMTVHALLHAVRTNKGREIVIAGHGSATQLSMHVARNIPWALNEEAISVFLDNLKKAISDEDAAQRFLTNVASFVVVRDELKKVQDLGLERVAIRACNIGKSPSLLEKLTSFFGCTKICAPKYYDLFAKLDPGQPTTDESTWKNWLLANPQAIIEGSKPNRFALRVDPTGQTFALADSWLAVRTWIKKHLPSGSYDTGIFYITGILGNKLTYPMDPNYRDQLVLLGKSN